MFAEISMDMFIKPLVFIAAATPLVVHNLRTGEITNQDNLILFFAGLAVLVIGPAWGLQTHQSPSSGFYLLAVVILAFGSRRGWMGGGAAKFLMALLPWFPRGEYMFAAIAGFFAAGVVGSIRKQEEVQPVPMVVAIGLLIHMAGVADVMLHGPRDQATQHTNTQPVRAFQ